MTKPLAILGSTGSIGTQVLDVVRRLPERFQVVSLSAGRNIERLAEQIQEFQPRRVALQEAGDISRLRAMVPDYHGKIVAGEEGLLALAEDAEVETVIVGLVGLCGLAPSMRALKTGKYLLTANKETFVTGGHLVQPFLDRVIPIDSEHVAIHQCLRDEPVETVSKLYLTASGGPFRNLSSRELENVTREQALKHPNWVMGPKITIDSATLMNKGLEVLEAHWLFGVPFDRIQVVVHPQSIIHSGVAFVDGSVLMQMGAPDMHGPIQYAMTYPERLDNPEPGVRFDMLELSRLDFEPPDMERFPCLRLAFEAGRMGSSAAVVLNGADEVAVQLFLEEKIRYVDIPRLLEEALNAHQKDGLIAHPTLDEIRQLDAWTREFVAKASNQPLLT